MRSASQEAFDMMDRDLFVKATEAGVFLAELLLWGGVGSAVHNRLCSWQVARYRYFLRMCGGVSGS